MKSILRPITVVTLTAAALFAAQASRTRMAAAAVTRTVAELEADGFLPQGDPDGRKGVVLDGLRGIIADRHDSIRTLDPAVAEIDMEFDSMARRVADYLDGGDVRVVAAGDRRPSRRIGSLLDARSAVNLLVWRARRVALSGQSTALIAADLDRAYRLSRVYRGTIIEAMVASAIEEMLAKALAEILASPGASAVTLRDKLVPWMAPIDAKKRVLECLTGDLRSTVDAARLDDLDPPIWPWAGSLEAYENLQEYQGYLDEYRATITGIRSDGIDTYEVRQGRYIGQVIKSLGQSVRRRSLQRLLNRASLGAAAFHEETGCWPATLTELDREFAELSYELGEDGVTISPENLEAIEPDERRRAGLARTMTR